MKAVMPYEKEGLSIKRANALDVLSTGKVPASEIDKRPGAGGKSFSYVKHTYATRLLQDGFGPLWSFECLDYQVFRDTLYKNVKKGKETVKEPFEMRSIAARCCLTIAFPVKDSDQLHYQHVTEIGAFEPNAGMSTANGVASAVSRALCKCLMRILGVGLELYEDGEQAGVTSKQAWNILKRYLEARGIEWTDEFQDNLKAALKKVGIDSQAELVDKFNLAYEVANAFLDTDEDVPLKQE